MLDKSSNTSNLFHTLVRLCNPIVTYIRLQVTILYACNGIHRRTSKFSNYYLCDPVVALQAKEFPAAQTTQTLYGQRILQNLADYGNVEMDR